MAKLEDVNAKLDYLEITKTLIKEAIENKGQEIEESDTFREFVNKIANISTKSNFIYTYNLNLGRDDFQVGDIVDFTIGVNSYNIGDFTVISMSNVKNIGAQSIINYVVKIAVAEVTNKEPISTSTEKVYFKLDFIYNKSFPKFITNTVEETGLKYGNEVTNGEKNWYSYDYSNLDVAANDVLNNKKFLGISGIEVGNMPNNGELNYTPSNNTQSIPAGYTSGGTISAMDITSSTAYLNSLALSKEILGIE